jgi:PhzF family phenazine biosynthesis protein
MRTPIFQIDAFTTRRFAGNPAAVMPMARFLPDTVMQAIAAENNLAETAFLVPEGGDYRLRWFTPKVEVPLCGHATLRRSGDGAARSWTQQRGLPLRERAPDGEARGCRLRHGLPG